MRAAGDLRPRRRTPGATATRRSAAGRSVGPVQCRSSGRHDRADRDRAPERPHGCATIRSFPDGKSVRRARSAIADIGRAGRSSAACGLPAWKPAYAARASAAAADGRAAPAAPGLPARWPGHAGLLRPRAIQALLVAANIRTWRTHRALTGAATMFKQGRPLAPAQAWAVACLLCLVIVGCAAPSRTARPGAGAPAAPAAQGPIGQPAPAPPLPDVELTGPLLFELVAAEVAAQRGESSAAYATLMKAARDTRDPRLARRATEGALGA